MVRLADTIYKRYRTASEESELGIAWVLALMAAYNPVTKYIYDNEAERKRSRFAESVIASETPQEEVDRSLRVWVAQNKQLAEDVTFDAMVQAYADDGVENVEWVTHPDDRRCSKCKAMHGKIYPIDKIPAKPHIHCRCWVEEVAPNNDPD
jgi:SPP1 gp7 family putative phage head morphogenesis protein